jgi:hypothetical protein
LRRCASAAAPAALVLAIAACSVRSPGSEVKEALAGTGRIELAAGAGRAVLERPRFSDVTVDVQGGRARVLAMVEADGRWRAGDDEVAVAYVGREAFEMERCAAARWCPAGAALPALAGVLAAVGAGRRAGERPVAWQIRVDRDRAVVGEDVAGAAGARGRRRLDLVRDGSGWAVASRP